LRIFVVAAASRRRRRDTLQLHSGFGAELLSNLVVDQKIDDDGVGGLP
jgi:hypothetical protein